MNKQIKTALNIFSLYVGVFITIEMSASIIFILWTYDDFTKQFDPPLNKANYQAIFILFAGLAVAGLMFMVGMLRKISQLQKDYTGLMNIRDINVTNVLSDISSGVENVSKDLVRNTILGKAINKLFPKLSNNLIQYYSWISGIYIALIIIGTVLAYYLIPGMQNNFQPEYITRKNGLIITTGTYYTFPIMFCLKMVAGTIICSEIWFWVLNQIIKKIEKE